MSEVSRPSSGIRIAAVGDVHFVSSSKGSLRPALEDLDGSADVLLIAGDLTMHGRASEAAVLAGELQGLPIPMVSVLGNHDYHCDEDKKIRDIVEEAGIIVLEGEATVVATRSGDLGIAGTKGFGGGFPGASGSDFGEPEMKAFMRHSKALAARFTEALSSLQTTRRVALLHYSPVEATLVGERLEIYPFLGTHLLGDAVDAIGADLVLHGHAHTGTEEGATPGGIPVRNVALSVIGAPYLVYELPKDGEE